MNPCTTAFTTKSVLISGYLHQPSQQQYNESTAAATAGRLYIVSAAWHAIPAASVAAMHIQSGISKVLTAIGTCLEQMHLLESVWPYLK